MTVAPRAGRLGRRSLVIGAVGATGVLALGAYVWRERRKDLIESRTRSPVSLRRIARAKFDAEELVWSPDNRRLAVLLKANNGVVVILDTGTWTEVSRFEVGTYIWKPRMGFLSDSELVTIPRDNHLGLWSWEVRDIETGRLTRQIPRPPGLNLGQIERIVVSSDRKFVAAIKGYHAGVTVGREVSPAVPLLFEAESGNFIGRLVVPARNIHGVAAGPGNQLAVAASNGIPSTREEVFLLNAATNRVDQVLAGHIGGVESLAWSPDGRMLASGSEGLLMGVDHRWLRDRYPIRFWSIDTAGIVASFHGMFEGVRDLTWHPSGSILGTTSGRGDGSLGIAYRLWSLSGGQMIFEYFPSYGLLSSTYPGALSFQPKTGHLLWNVAGSLEVFEVLGLG